MINQEIKEGQASNQQQKLNQEEPNLGDFFNSGELSDVTLVDNNDKNKKYQLHKIILASKSSYFRKHFKEQPNEKEVILPNLVKLNLGNSFQDNSQKLNFQPVKEVNIVETVLKFIYSDYDFSVLTNEGLNSLNCLNFFSYFSTLKVNSGLFLIEKYILQYILNSQTCIEILKIGLQFQNQSFIDNSVLLIAEKFGKMLKTSSQFYEQLLELNYDAFQKVMSSQDLQVENEDIVLQIIFDYITNQNSSQVENNNKNSEKDVPPQILGSETQNLQNAESEAVQKGNQQQNNENNLNVPDPNNPNQQSEAKSNSSEPQQSQEDQQKKETNQNPELNQADQNVPSEKATEEQIQNQKNGDDKESLGNKTEKDQKTDNSHQTNQNLNQTGAKQKQVLNDQQIEDLLNNIRLGYVSHSVLTHFSQQPVFKNQRDLFFKAISLKLSKYELNTVPNYQGLNWNPRESYINNVELLNPNITETYLNVSQTGVKNPNGNTGSDQGTSRVNYSPQRSQVNQQGIRLQEQSRGNFFSQSHHNINQNFIKPNQSRSLAFTYSSDFDENGLFYFLGTKNRSIEFNNPFYLNEVMPFCSSLKSGRIEDLTARLPVNTICTENDKNSFFGFDLGDERYFFPTCYTLRNRSQPSCILYNWIVEGSNDNMQWYEIDKRIHFSKDSKYNLLIEKERELLRKPNQSSTWGIDTGKLKEILRSISIDTVGFRAFRITQISMNGNNTHELAIGALEFYGKGYGVNWKI